jgi:hypothetical protein
MISFTKVGDYNTSYMRSTVHQRIGVPRLKFELFCDWLEIGHVVWMLVYDWM